MPIHDWTRVSAGVFHHFHFRWIAALSDWLNGGNLPEGYFAMAEQIPKEPIPDVLTLQAVTPAQSDAASTRNGSKTGVAVADAPPKTRFIYRSDTERYALKKNRIAIRHESGAVIAMIEVVSPGNKSSKHALRAFVAKAWEFLDQGIHVVVLDLFPPTRRDPQ